MTTTKQKSRAETQNIKREKTEKNIIEDYRSLAQECKEKETMELQNNQKTKDKMAVAVTDVRFYYKASNQNSMY